MNSFLSCLVCFNGCIYVQNTILNKRSLFPWPAHTFAEHYGYKQGQEMGSNNFVTSAKLRVAGAR